MRLGPDEVLTFQTARCTTPLAGGGSELDVLVAAVCDAAALIGSRPAASPWLTPLAAQLAGRSDRDVAQGVVGVVDDPDGQRVLPLRWDRAAGNLLLVGATGSGLTSTLALLGTVAATRWQRQPPLRHRRSWRRSAVGVRELAVVRRCRSTARTRTVDQADHPARPTRSVGGSPTHRLRAFPIVVLVDGLDAVRSSLDDLDTLAEFDMLDTIITLGPAHDVVVVCAFDRVASIPSTVLARCPQRWVFHLTDPLDASALGHVACRCSRADSPVESVVASTSPRGTADGRIAAAAVVRRRDRSRRGRVPACRRRCCRTAGRGADPATTRCCRSVCASATVGLCSSTCPTASTC